MADGVEQIAAQTDPVGQTIEGYVRPNGLRIEKRRVPLGVVLFFYESRPNVTSDAAALCLKSGNAVILRGGKERFIRTRRSSTSSPPRSSRRHRTGRGAACRLDRPRARPAAAQARSLHRPGDPPRRREPDPRGREDSTIPVLKHFTGNCHIYVDADAASNRSPTCA
jgi:glutamate-5-semialdehyde dehydrogenase